MKRWSSHDEDFLSQVYGVLDINEISFILQRTIRSIKHKVHNSKIIGCGVCRRCGTLFERKSSRQRFCKECLVRKCRGCGKDYFHRNPNPNVHNYCSMKCYHNSKRVIKICKACGKSFDCLASTKSIFCSRKCGSKGRQTLKKNNKLELKVQKCLSDLGIKFETHLDILGKPDIFIRPDLFIFIDGNYWHGNPLTMNGDDYIMGRMKVKDQRRNDAMVNYMLIKCGYKVLRFWESDINDNIEEVISTILRYGNILPPHTPRIIN